MRFDLAGRATLALVGAPEVVTRRILAQMDPYAPTLDEERGADVVLERTGRNDRAFVDIQNPAADGIVTASDGTSLYLVEDASSCMLAPLADGAPARFVYEPDFPIARAFGRLVRPALQLAVLDHAAVAVHGASVDVGGRGIVVAGWSETGKTETALAFLEEGAGFVSDKWTIVGADRTIAAFPISVGIRRWVLPYAPRLRAALPPRARTQLAAASAAAVAMRPLRRLRRFGKGAELAVTAAERAVALGDRAALTPSELSAVYRRKPEQSWTANLGALALLTTVSTTEVRATRADAVWVARRLARSAAFERRAYFDLHERRRYAFPQQTERADVEAREERFLAELLADTLVLDVRAPFPTDPRRVADAIARFI